MSPGTIVRFSPVLRALDPAGVHGTVIESTTRERLEGPRERAILVAPLEGPAVWIELEGPAVWIELAAPAPDLRVTG